jgi:hypothetical protein
MRKSFIRSVVALLLICICMVTTSMAQEKVAITTGFDFYSRYAWRGLDIANTPSLQPTLAAGYQGFELGIWGAYTLSNQAWDSDEIDFWLGYTADLSNSAAFSLLATDYYYPNAGIDFFNFNNYDATFSNGQPNPGAHLFELGVSVTGPEKFPVTMSGYVNVYNDAGNNTYFEIDYPLSLDDADLNFFVGATGGSKDNPSYYGADEFKVINVGVEATRDLQVSESFSMPLHLKFYINPNEEFSHFVVGLSF